MPANKDETKRKAPPHAFKKGQSGNPSGRPKRDPELMKILKAAVPDVGRKLVDLAQSEDPKVALQACKEILDRTQGKPETTNKVALSGEIAVTPATILEALRSRRDDGGN